MSWYYWIIVIVLIVVLLFLLTGCLIRTGFKKHIKKQMDLNAEQLFDLPDDELVSAIIFRTDAIYFDADGNALKAMNRSVRTAYTVALFDLEVQNGGLCQYLSNSSRETAPYLSEALKQTGAAKTEEILAGFVLENKIDLHDLSGFDSIKGYEEKTKTYPFDDFDHQFTENYEIENLDTLNAKFIREHISDFA